MIFLAKVINTLSNLLRSIALLTMAFMMFFITAAVFSRLLFTPIIGDVEVIQLGMVVLIMCGLAYTHQVNGHISIEFIVKKFPNKAQYLINILAQLLTLIATLVVTFIYIEVAFNHKNHMHLSTGLLEIPYYPFDFIIVLGFLMWGLEALLKLIYSIMELFTSKTIDG
ncbi:TRAP transporter small permease [Virgibacillus sediminis]|uniref:TRAP transporter small permease n=1 Tax=Virgibacillus sediminis TaxID=202260 RepID=A0ABV7A9B9_9BACI